MSRALAIETPPAILFSEATQEIGAKAMAKILSCGLTHVYKQAADPRYNEETRTSFIEKMERFFTALMEKNPTLARIIADRICRICGGRFATESQAVADKPTLPDELLDNISALAEYTDIMRNPKTTIDERHAAKRALIDEIEQDFDRI